MTVREVLEANVRALQNLRVPLGEPDIYQAISNTIHDLMACVDAIARSEAKAQEQATEQAEPEQQDGTEEG